MRSVLAGLNGVLRVGRFGKMWDNLGVVSVCPLVYLAAEKRLAATKEMSGAGRLPRFEPARLVVRFSGISSTCPPVY